MSESSEVKIPETVNTEQVQNSVPSSTDKKEISEVPESVQEVNWRNFREERKKQRQETEEAKKIAAQKESEARALKEAMEALLNKPAIQTNDIQEEPDEKESIKKLIADALADERRRVEKERMDREARELPNRIQANMKDFHEVCSAENVDYLEYHYPEITAGFKYMPDGYEKWEAIYKSVKRLIPNAQVSNKDKAKAERNMMKPQSISVAGVTSTGDMAPQMLTDQKKMDNWKRMAARMKGLG